MMIETRSVLEEMPQKRPFNAGALACSQVAVSTKAYWDDCATKSPDADAINFYGANHLAMLVAQNFTPNEKLPDFARDALRFYRTTLAEQAMRMFHYMLLITTRESRHVKHTSKFPALEKSIKEKQGEFCMEFNSKINGKGSGQTAEFFCDHPPEGPLGPYVQSLERIFFEGSFSGGYGGKPWGEIAANLRRCVEGEISLETMVDTGYTLAHNNGPTFNKGMMYSMYSSEFLQILDVQRAGQIPNAVVEGRWGHASSGTAELKALIHEFRKHMPEKIGTYVDWYAVEAAGALGSYSFQKATQDKKYPKNMLFSNVPKSFEVPKEAEAIKYYQVDHILKVAIMMKKRGKV